MNKLRSKDLTIIVSRSKSTKFQSRDLNPGTSECSRLLNPTICCARMEGPWWGQNRYNLAAKSRLHHCLGTWKKGQRMSSKMSPENFLAGDGAGCIFSPENSLLRGACSKPLWFGGCAPIVGSQCPAGLAEYLAHYLTRGSSQISFLPSSLLRIALFTQ